MRVVFSLPFRTTYDLNGHNFIEHQLSSSLSNSCGLGKRILHAVPDLAWNF